MKENGVVKILKLLLLRLGLWVPLVFSLLFLLIMLISGTAFSDVSALFLVGVILTAVFGVTSGIMLNLKRLDKKEKKKKEERSTRFVAPVRTEEEVGFTEGTPTPRPTVTKEGAPAPERLFPTNAEEDAEHERRYIERDVEQNDFAADGSVTTGGTREDFGFARREESVQEQPRIFRTRMDENMLIYEYSDRLEFYRYEGQRLVHLSTEYKQR